MSDITQKSGGCDITTVFFMPKILEQAMMCGLVYAIMKKLLNLDYVHYYVIGRIP